MLPRARFLYALSAYSLRHKQLLSDLYHQGKGEGGREAGYSESVTADSPSDFHGDRCATCALPAIHGVCWLVKTINSIFNDGANSEQDDVQPILAVDVGVDNGAGALLPVSGV